MPRRTATQLEHHRIVEDVLTVLALAPTASLDDVVERVPASRATIQRAFRARGTSFKQERRGRLLDRAALVLIKQYGRGQSVALLNAAQAAGGYRPRHLCAPFRERYGVTPGVVWSIGAAIRGLHSIAASPAPHSRRESAAYARRRRRVVRLRRRLERVQPDLVQGSVVAEEVQIALALATGSRERTRSRRRARPRARGRRRRSR